MQRYIIGLFFIALGVGVLFLSITNSRFSRPWWLPRSFDEENFSGRFFTGVIGVIFSLVGLAILIISLLGY